MSALLERIADRTDRSATVARPWWSRWIWWLAMGAVAVLGLLVGYWILTRDRRELAKLRHEKFASEVREQQRQVDASIAVEQATVAEQEAAATAAHLQADAIDQSIADVEARHAENLLAVDRIRSWSDVARKR